MQTEEWMSNSLLLGEDEWDVGQVLTWPIYVIIVRYPQTALLSGPSSRNLVHGSVQTPKHSESLSAEFPLRFAIGDDPQWTFGHHRPKDQGWVFSKISISMKAS